MRSLLTSILAIASLVMGGSVISGSETLEREQGDFIKFTMSDQF